MLFKKRTISSLLAIGALSGSSVIWQESAKATSSSTNAVPYSIIREEPVVTEEKPKQTRLVCKGCSSNEIYVLNFLQDKGIKDKNAIATIMGNIRQESSFVPNICEGGGRINYESCGGGYGLIQWTSSSRYYGLGKHASKMKQSPSSLSVQLDYLLQEVQWKRIETKMKTPGRSIDHYMNIAYNWIGWGHHGARTTYARQYANKISLQEV